MDIEAKQLTLASNIPELQELIETRNRLQQNLNLDTDNTMYSEQRTRNIKSTISQLNCLIAGFENM